MKSQFILAVILCLTGSAAFAKSKKSADQQPAPVATPDASKPADAQAPGAPPSEKLDVSDLENKYWAPKDTDFSVVQNRTFTKEKKLFLSAFFGPDLTGGNYLAGNDLGLSANYFFNERYGVQATYYYSYLHSNAAVGDLVQAGGYPNFGIPRAYEGVGFNWVPFYSKMSFLGKKILYFDMAISPTIGVTQYDQQTFAGNHMQNAFTYGFDITQYYFFTSHFAIRADLKNQWWHEDVIRATTSQVAGGGAVGDPVKSQLDREMIFLLGFTYYFGF